MEPASPRLSLAPARAAVVLAAQPILRGGAALAVATAPLMRVAGRVRSCWWRIRRLTIHALQLVVGRRGEVDSTVLIQTEVATRQPRSLWNAVKSGDLNAAKALVESTPSTLEDRGPCGETPIHWCFLYYNEAQREIARWLLEEHPFVSSQYYNQQEYYGETVLHMAIVHKDEEMVKTLLKIDPALLHLRATGTLFQPGSPCYYGEYAVFFAACTNQPTMVELLLDHGASLGVSDSHRNSVWHLLVIHGLPDMYDYLQRRFKETGQSTTPWCNLNEDQLTPFTLAASIGQQDMFRHLLYKDDQVEWVYGPVSLHLYPLDELDHVRGNRKTALQLLVEKEHTDLLIEPRIVAVLQKKWSTYAGRIFYQRLILIIVYLGLFTYCCITRPKGSPPDGFHVAADCLVTLGAMYKSVVELREMWCGGLGDYFLVRGSMFLENVSSLFHCVAVTAAGGIRFNAYWHSGIHNTGPQAEAFAAVAAVCGWCYLLFFCLGFQLTGPFVVMLSRMLVSDVLRFCLIYIVFLMGFATAFFLIFNEHGLEAFIQRVKICFLTLLGSDSVEVEAPGKLSFIVWVAYVVMVSILLLNLLIAMMGDTYSRVLEDADKQWHLEWARIIFSLEKEMTPDSREARENRYWSEVNGKRYMQVQEVNTECFRHPWNQEGGGGDESSAGVGGGVVRSEHPASDDSHGDEGLLYCWYTTCTFTTWRAGPCWVDTTW